MSVQIFSVRNQSRQSVLLTVQGKEAGRFDVLLGPGRSVEYPEVAMHSGPLIPEVGSQAEWEQRHVRLNLGERTYHLYVSGGVPRHSTAGRFEPEAPVIPGYAGPGLARLGVDAAGALSLKAEPAPRGLGSVWWAAGRYALYVVTEQGRLLEKTWVNHWEPTLQIRNERPGLPGELVGPVAGVSPATGWYSLFAVRSDGLLVERQWSLDHWREWSEHLGPEPSIAGLAALSPQTHLLRLYAVGASREMYERRWDGKQWSSWSGLGQPPGRTLAGPVAGVCWALERFGVYALDVTGEVWERWWPGKGDPWHSVQCPDREPLVSLTACVLGAFHYRIGGVSAAGNAWTRTWQQSWGPWTSLGHPASSKLAGPAALASWGVADATFYAAGADGQVYGFYNGKWGLMDPR